MRAIMLALTVVLAVGVAACGDNPPVVYPTVAPFDDSKLALGPGDKIELTIFYGSEESKATYTLDGSGQLEVRFIGSVEAKGKTARETQEMIRSRLADGYLKDPVVSLTVVEINSLKCSVFGQVGSSGSVKFTPGMTITEAIAKSGGFTPLARKNMVKVTRLVSDKKETYKIPVEMIAAGERPNFPMMPGDEVFVPERPW
ncbi:MAG: polysaccharide export protein [Deltaproteobacteria bacterium]|nr:polysaccharide export protein [Deltaproteobacteria bacterium]